MQKTLNLAGWKLELDTVGLKVLTAVGRVSARKSTLQQVQLADESATLLLHQLLKADPPLRGQALRNHWID